MAQKVLQKTKSKSASKKRKPVAAKIVAQAKRQIAKAAKARQTIRETLANPATSPATLINSTPAASQPPSDFESIFSTITEPRIERKRQHALLDILFISVVATLAGAEGPSDIAEFARQKLAWCRRFVPLLNGVPSHDTIGRVIALLKPVEFQRAFLEWLGSWKESAAANGELEHIAIDGKTARGSASETREKPLHLVSAWASRLGLTLGQVAVAEKSNEITAIPHLLQMLELNGAIVSIDAMGCQKEIASQIIAGEGHYLLPVKGNQPTLNSALTNFFLLHDERKDWDAVGCSRLHTKDKSRGRDEDRWYSIAPLPDELKHFANDWLGLCSIGCVRNVITGGETPICETRYYISSRPPLVNEFAAVARKHWSIESMHWTLDVVFGEDASRLRAGHLVENFSFLRKFAISLFKRDTSAGSIKQKRKRAGWNSTFLENVLFS